MGLKKWDLMYGVNTMYGVKMSIAYPDSGLQVHDEIRLLKLDWSDLEAVKTGNSSGELYIGCSEFFQGRASFV